MQQSPYESYNNQIGVKLSFLLKDSERKHEGSLSLISYGAYEKRVLRKPELKLRAGGGKDNEVLLNWSVLPYEWKQSLIDTFPDPETAKPIVLERFYSRDPKAANFYANDFERPDGRGLKAELIKEYTTNASVLNAIIQLQAKRIPYKKSLGGNNIKGWALVIQDVEALREKLNHTLKTPSLKNTLSKYKRNGYIALVNGKLCNVNSAKVKTEENIILIEELLKKHNNLDNEQIKSLYNIVAEQMGWKPVSAGTIANYRKELDPHTYAGRRGETNFRNNRSMLVKRRAPAYPLYYWTMDGWDAELLYQKSAANKDGYSVTTYHNRLNVVIVLDPCCKYPVGYAIGTHETPLLIKEALRNAANHTKEIFGCRFKPLQLQTDNYGKGTLKPLYEAMTEHYTPARVKNAKAKVIEPYFKAINKKYCQLLPNWSGFGVTSDKTKQPNADYLNKIRHQFPDESGCRAQLEHIIQMERRAKREEFLSKWKVMPQENRLELSTPDYLNLFGETTGYTNRIEAVGFNPTILGEKRVYDTFDSRFHQLRHVDWVVKYDPDDLSEVLVVDAIGRNGRLEKEVNTMRFLLSETYEQPMALVERTEGDAAQLQLVRNHNKQLEQNIIERGTRNRGVLDELFEANPQLNDTLTKLILCDSNGQHKNNKSNARLMESAKRLEAKQTRKEVKQDADEHLAMREAYIDSKINIDDFLNL